MTVCSTLQQNLWELYSQHCRSTEKADFISSKVTCYIYNELFVNSMNCIVPLNEPGSVSVASLTSCAPPHGVSSFVCDSVPSGQRPGLLETRHARKELQVKRGKETSDHIKAPNYNLW